MNDLIIYAASASTFGLGYFWGKRDYQGDLAFWKNRATAWAGKGVKDMANSQARLADALATKNERLDRIIAKGRESKSGTAQHLAKIAAGEA